ncbi:MAG: DUF3575 domain-containing protein [Clostridium sp.]|nr:DUF3575 domain-containing protein [Clostridium sp.]
MIQYKTIKIFAFLLLSAAASAMAQENAESAVISHSDSVMINFRQSKWNLDPRIGNNAAVLDSIDHRLSSVLGDSVYRLRNVSVYGGASPEGSVSFNKFLSEHRAETLFGWFDKYRELSPIEKKFTYFGRDWEGVLRLAEKDPNVPFRDETIALLRAIVKEKQDLGGNEPKRSLERMKALRGGAPYIYLYHNIFPHVRASKVVIAYDQVLPPAIAEPEPVAKALPAPDTVYVDRFVEVHDTIYINTCEKGPFYMDIRTNMLYDALALPNIGVEFYLGKNFSIGANWMYGWWKTDKHHRYWRAYGGEIFGRWWFGRKAQAKPLQGHHLGLYAQLYTYDFEWGGTGEMGGKPGGTLWDKYLWGVGFEYGYSLPVAKRLNIDFSIGLGYTTGLYHKYKPIDDHYVWQSTHRRKYFGPTKLEVALVWLIGRGNVNEKGGAK